MRIRPLVLATMGLAAAAACSNDGTGSSESALTYYRDVKPIVDAKCVGCHNANGIAPFSLDNPTDVIEHGAEMLDAIETGIMPPWPPNDSCNQYLGDRSLSAEQKQTLRTWLDGGKAKGDSGKEGAPLDVERVQLTRVDREITMEPIPGAVPSPLNAPAGCRYADRCPWVEERCRRHKPAMTEIAPEHFVACHVVADAAGSSQPRGDKP